MLPLHIKVAAIDDNEDHLQKIIWGLGKAGFSSIPFLFEDGRLERAPLAPIPGIRLVFSDIHIVPGGQHMAAANASNIVRCLKSIVGEGPYALIFWSQFPTDLEEIQPLIEERAREQNLTLPLVFGRIDKKEVFDVNAVAGSSDNFNPNVLRDLILAQLGDLKVLAIAASWDERVAAAAAKTTNQLFKLTEDVNNRQAVWGQLLAFLASEAIGYNNAKASPRGALDSALIPLLEDQLAMASSAPIDSNDTAAELSNILNTGRPNLPVSIKAEMLNSSYLIEEIPTDSHYKMYDRGVVTKLGGGYVNSGEFVRAFGGDDTEVLNREFLNEKLTPQEASLIKLHVVEVGPECDHVQGKISTHVYLLALLTPESIFSKCVVKSRSGAIQRYRNVSILDSGQLSLSGRDEPHHLLISCRCFMSLAQGRLVDGTPQFRIRKDLLNEVLHQYTNHARRPGVMRF